MLESYATAKTVEALAKPVMIASGIVVIGGVAYLIADGVYGIFKPHAEEFQYIRDNFGFQGLGPVGQVANWLFPKSEDEEEVEPTVV